MTRATHGEKELSLWSGGIEFIPTGKQGSRLQAWLQEQAAECTHLGSQHRTESQPEVEQGCELHTSPSDLFPLAVLHTSPTVPMQCHQLGLSLMELLLIRPHAELSHQPRGGHFCAQWEARDSIVGESLTFSFCQYKEFTLHFLGINKSGFCCFCEYLQIDNLGKMNW